MMTFRLMQQNQRWLWHVNVCCISQGSIKTPVKGDRWFWCHFITHLLGYMCTNTYSNGERFDKVNAKIKRCSFFAPQCSTTTTTLCRNALPNDTRKLLVSQTHNKLGVRSSSATDRRL